MTYNISKAFVDFLPPLLSEQLPCICELRASDLPKPIFQLQRYAGAKGAKSLDEAELTKDEGEPGYRITHRTRVPHTLRGRTNPSVPTTPFRHLAPTLLSCPLASSPRPGFLPRPPVPSWAMGWRCCVVGHGLPMGKGGQEPAAHGEFTSEDPSPTAPVKGFLSCGQCGASVWRVSRQDGKMTWP